MKQLRMPLIALTTTLLLAPTLARGGIFGILNEVENVTQGAGFSLPTSLNNLYQMAQNVHDGGVTAIPGLAKASNGNSACPPGYVCAKDNSPFYPASANIPSEIAELKYIQEGYAGPIIYVFLDPLCPYCHQLFTQNIQLIQEGRLIIRYIPVALLGSQSTQIASYLLQSPNPAQQLNTYEAIAFTRNNGGIRNFMGNPYGMTEQQLQINKRVMEDLGFNGVPGLVFRLTNGQFEHIQGLISQQRVKGLIPQMVNVAQVHAAAPGAIESYPVNETQKSQMVGDQSIAVGNTSSGSGETKTQEPLNISTTTAPHTLFVRAAMIQNKEPFHMQSSFTDSIQNINESMKMVADPLKDEAEETSTIVINLPVGQSVMHSTAIRIGQHAWAKSNAPGQEGWHEIALNELHRVDLLSALLPYFRNVHAIIGKPVRGHATQGFQATLDKKGVRVMARLASGKAISSAQQLIQKIVFTIFIGKSQHLREINYVEYVIQNGHPYQVTGKSVYYDWGKSVHISPPT